MHVRLTTPEAAHDVRTHEAVLRVNRRAAAFWLTTPPSGLLPDEAPWGRNQSQLLYRTAS
eukprot:11209216-Lingulodinium_polyedra.AAC.1